MLNFLWRQKPESKSQTNSETRSLAEPAPTLLDVFGLTAASASGITVTPETAMSSTAVKAAVQAISEAVGYLPLHVYEKAASDERRRFTAHPAYGLLRYETNQWTDAGSFREQLTRDALLYGDGFAVIVRDGTNRPRELHRVHPTRVEVKADEQSGEPQYTLRQQSAQQSGERRYAWQDVLHIKGTSINGIRGTSPVEQCREAIALNLQLEAHAARLFANGGRPSGLLKFPNRLGNEVAARIKASWKAATSGANSGATAVLEEGGDFTPLSFTSVDAQFLEIWERSVYEIARAFKVPPHLIFELGRATWGNAAEMGAGFLRFTLTPWLKRWEAEVRLKLISNDERANVYAEFLTDDLLRTDLAARADAYGKLIASRIINPNEARARENLPPYAGGDVFANPNTTTTNTTTQKGNTNE